MNMFWKGESRSMAKVDRKYLLTATQMAEFVRDGYLMIEGLVPSELNAPVYADQVAGNGRWHESESIKAVFEWEPVKGILQSLVGECPIYDHSALHVVGPNQHGAQVW